jgi:hypothetical protein
LAQDRDASSPGSVGSRHNGHITTGFKTEILRNAYFLLSQEPLTTGSPLLRVVRTAAPFLDLGDARFQYSYLISRIDRHGRSGRFLLVDLRAAPGRNDPGFEALMAELRPKLFQGFRRVGVLTATASGTLQVMRHTRQDGVDALISSNEAELLSFFRVAGSWK